MLDLEAIELIKQLKARYFRFLDTGDFAGLESVFAKDATAHFHGGSYEFTLNGWEDLEKFYRRAFTSTRFGMHTGHHPEISVDGEQATGIWYLQDTFYYFKDNYVIRGTSLYTDSYAKIDGEWKISASGYKRLLEEKSPIDPNVEFIVKPIN